MTYAGDTTPGSTFKATNREVLYPRGVTIPSPQHLEKVRHAPRITRVRLNALGLKRLNDHRETTGLHPLTSADITVAPIGEEIMTGIDTTTGSNFLLIQGSGVVDNSQLGAFPPIRSQGSEGSCAAFSTTYYQMTHMTALVRGWNAKTGGDTFRFSPKWTYNMVNNGVDNGSSLDENLNVVRDHGCATWTQFPYSGSTSDVRPWCMTPAVWSNAISFRMNSYSVLDSLYTSNGLANLKAVLDNGYVVTFDTYSPWPYSGWVKGTVGNDPSTTADDSFVGQDICEYVRELDWGHALTIVGYNDAIWCDLNGNGVVDSGEKGALKIANSWDSSWGNDGYAWFSYDALKTTSAVAGWNPSSKVYGFGYGDSAAECIAYVTSAKPVYSPQFLARFTVRHSSRDQLSFAVAKDSSSVTNSPIGTWTPVGLNYCGGPYAFDGSSTTCDGTFYLDLTDVNPDPALLKRYFVAMTSATGIGQLKSYTILDCVNHEEVTVTPTSSVSFNPPSGVVTGKTAWAWVNMGVAFPSGQNLCSTNPASITIPQSGAATPYPSPLTVSGLPANPIKVTVTLNGLSHTYPDDINVLLVGPSNQTVILMTSSGGGNSISGVALTFDDAADASLSSYAIQSRAYKPTDNGTANTLPSPAPARPYGNALSIFTNANPNGDWKLYVNDKSAQDKGSISGGWSLTFTYAPQPSSWLAWQTNSFTPLQLGNTTLSGPLGDLDNDTYCNLLEYAFNSDPRASTSTPARLSVRLAMVNGVLTPVFCYPRRTGYQDIMYSEETSHDLTTWAANQTTNVASIVDSNGVTETVETVLTGAPPASPHAYFRVTITKP